MAEENTVPPPTDLQLDGPIMDELVDVDFLILADWAEIIQGKLYLQGGGWHTMTATSFPHTRSVAVAAGLRVPWAATNQRYNVSITVKDEDAQTVAMRADAQLETGRPAGFPAGSDQLVQLALNGVVKFDQPGSYVISAEVDGEIRKRRVFRVVTAPGIAAPRRS